MVPGTTSYCSRYVPVRVLPGTTGTWYGRIECFEDYGTR